MSMSSERVLVTDEAQHNREKKKIEAGNGLQHSTSSWAVRFAWAEFDICPIMSIICQISAKSMNTHLPTCPRYSCDGKKDHQFNQLRVVSAMLEEDVRLF
jgi:hypothetical protein